MKGKVIHFGDRGFGFIKGEDSTDYFVHFKDIVDNGTGEFKKLEKGQHVQFVAGQGKKGPVALQVAPYDVGNE